MVQLSWNLGKKSAMGPGESKKGKLTTIHHLEIGEETRL